MTKPLHSLASPDLPRWEGIRPTGLPCREHAGGVLVDDRCYWCHKRSWLQGGHLSREALVYVGAIDPFPPDRLWRSHRGWRSLPEELRAMVRDQEREAEVRGIRYLVDLGEQTAELSV